MAEVRILVVDDDQGMRELMVRRLERMSLGCDQAADCPGALAHIREKPYDLLLTDIYMPGGTGLDLLRAAKDKDPLVQVVVVTGSATLDNAIEALNIGAFSFLNKPFEHIGVFDNTVARALEFRRLLRDNQRLAESQRRRGDMLEAEVTDRIRQMRQKQQDVVDLLARLPLGLLVVDTDGRVLLTNPRGEAWLAEDARHDTQPLREYLSTLKPPRRPTLTELALPGLALQLTAQAMPPLEGKGRTLVFLEECSSEREDLRCSLSPMLARLKPSLEWLSGQPLKEGELEVVKLLGSQVNALERMVAPLADAVIEAPGSAAAAVGQVAAAGAQAGEEAAPAQAEPASQPAPGRRGLLRNLKDRKPAPESGAERGAAPGAAIDLSDIFGAPPVQPASAEGAGQRLAFESADPPAQDEEQEVRRAALRAGQQWPPPLPSSDDDAAA